MSLPDLDRKCGECSGAGAVQAPAWADWWERVRAAAEVVPGATGVAGPEPEGPEEIPCGVCGGAQRVPTEEGERLLAFLSRHLESSVA